MKVWLLRVLFVSLYGLVREATLGFPGFCWVYRLVRPGVGVLDISIWEIVGLHGKNEEAAVLMMLRVISQPSMLSLKPSSTQP